MMVEGAWCSPHPGSNCHAARTHPGNRTETAVTSKKANDTPVFSKCLLPHGLRISVADHSITIVNPPLPSFPITSIVKIKAKMAIKGVFERPVLLVL